jgi:hypothetical protein
MTDFRIVQTEGTDTFQLQQLIYAFFETNGKDDPDKAGRRWETLSTHATLEEARVAASTPPAA